MSYKVCRREKAMTLKFISATAALLRSIDGESAVDVRARHAGLSGSFENESGLDSSRMNAVAIMGC